MRILVISDIHSNYTALETVLADAGAVDAIWCLGDLIGYGPDPNACIELIREQPALTCVLGNHDVALLGRMSFETFNGDARRSLEWHARVLMADNLDYLRAQPQDPLTLGRTTITHGSPRDPVWEYILNSLTARLNFDAFDTDWCLVGHTHIQSAFLLRPESGKVEMKLMPEGEPVRLTTRAILNPGSVGQPRDRDIRAAYALFDPEAGTWEARRVAYDYAQVQQRIRDAGLPERHAQRLGEGW